MIRIIETTLVEHVMGNILFVEKADVTGGGGKFLNNPSTMILLDMKPLEVRIFNPRS